MYKTFEEFWVDNEYDPHSYEALEAAWKAGKASELAKPEQNPMTVEQFTAIAHRTASKYSHRTDPVFVAYTFLPNTLEQFVRAIEAGVPAP